MKEHIYYDIPNLNIFDNYISVYLTSFVVLFDFRYLKHCSKKGNLFLHQAVKKVHGTHKKDLKPLAKRKDRPPQSVPLWCCHPKKGGRGCLPWTPAISDWDFFNLKTIYAQYNLLKQRGRRREQIHEVKITSSQAPAPQNHYCQQFSPWLSFYVYSLCLKKKWDLAISALLQLAFFIYQRKGSEIIWWMSFLYINLPPSF